MNKKTIITALLAIVALAGQAQVHYRIDGNTGLPDFTGTLYLYDYESSPNRVGGFYVLTISNIQIELFVYCYCNVLIINTCFPKSCKI